MTFTLLLLISALYAHLAFDPFSCWTASFIAGLAFAMLVNAVVLGRRPHA